MATNQLLTHKQFTSPVTPSQWGAYVRKRGQINSKCGFLLKAAVAWYRWVGLQIVFSEVCSCYHRIQLGWKTRCSHLSFEAVERSCPPLSLSAHDSRMEMQPYIRGIQALNAQRPWLSLGDSEIYLQGWFHARQVLCRTKDNGHQSTQPES